MSSDPYRLFDDVNARQGAFHRRALIMGGLAALGLTALGGRLAQLQLAQSGEYRLMSQENQFNFRLLPPPRGRILDRDGRPIADNRPNFRLMVIRDEVRDLDQTLNALQTLTPISSDRRREILREVSQAPRYAPVAIATDLEWQAFSAVNVRTPELPGVVAEMGEGRVYPYTGAFAHVVGYVGKINAREMAREPEQDRGPLLYHPGFRIGKTGVEKAFDRELRGEPGGRRVEVDARGRVIREAPEGNVPARPGEDIRLTLDIDIQNRALEVFGEHSGAAVMIDVRTGDILCMASAPSFDANAFVAGMRGAQYRALARYEKRPLLDKAMSGTYPPGSTFKPMTALAGLRAGIEPTRTFGCGGGLSFGGRFFRCHGRHGTQDLVNAIKNSCDVYFYQVARMVGPDAIAAVAHDFGFGQIFDIGIPGQSRGTVPSTRWKREYFARRNPANTRWFPGESLSYGIGQGALAVNPLQLAVMTARLANGRVALEPRLVRSIGNRDRPQAMSRPLPYAREHLDVVLQGMNAVTQVGGTAWRTTQLGLGPHIGMAGKTGTAQARTYGAGNRGRGQSIPWTDRDHNWFIAYAPVIQPRYAMSVLVQHGGGGGGSTAAPLAREIMKVALLKDPEMRRLIESPPPVGASPPAAPGLRA